jgi:hypothetical protein
MFEYRAVWQVTGGGTGYSVFHVREAVTPSIATAAQGFADDLRAGLNSLGGDLPNDVTISFESEAREIDVSTGTLIGVHGVTAPANVVGIQTGVYSAPSGAKVDLNTEAIVAGRRLKGRTFIVPLASTSYSDSGQVVTGARGRLVTAFEMFRDETDLYSLAVWSRTHGILADVVSVAASAKAAVLRSRRD